MVHNPTWLNLLFLTLLFYLGTPSIKSIKTIKHRTQTSIRQTASQQLKTIAREAKQLVYPSTKQDLVDFTNRIMLFFLKKKYGEIRMCDEFSCCFICIIFIYVHI